jgi:hypothetical protein
VVVEDAVTGVELAPRRSGAGTRRDAVRAHLGRIDGDVRVGLASTGRHVARAAGYAGDRALTRILTTPERVASAADGKALLASGDHPELVADRLQRVVMAAIPVIRVVGRGSRFVRIPSVFVVSTALSSVMTIRRGVRELQVISALVEQRLEQATGEPADAALASALAVSLYLEPKHEPQPSRSRRRVGRIALRLALRGVFGRDTGHAAALALDAAERIDGAAQAARWTDQA